MKRFWPIVGLLVLMALQPSPAAAQHGGREKAKLLERTARLLADYAIACLAEGKASTPSLPSWLGERVAAGPERKPRLLIAGFDRRDSPLSPAHQDSLTGQLLDRVSPFPDIDLVKLADLGWRLDLVMDAFGQNRSRELSKQFDATKVDAIVKMEGSYASGGRKILVRAILQRLDGTCYKQTEQEEIALAGFEQTLPHPREVMREAVEKLFAAHKDVKSVVILRTALGVTPIDTKIAAPLEDELKRLVEAAAGPRGGEGQAAEIKSGADGQAAATGIPVYRMGSGQFPPRATGGPNVWLARIAIKIDGTEPSLGLELMPAVGKEKIAVAPVPVSAQIVGAVRAGQPPAELVADPTFPAGQNLPLAFNVRVHRASGVYCAMQELDGEVNTLYPTPTAPLARVLPAASVMSYPQLQGADALPLDDPARAMIRCLAFPGGLPLELDRRWRQQDHTTRVKRGVAGPMTGKEFAQLVQELTEGREAFETETVLHILPAARQ